MDNQIADTKNYLELNRSRIIFKPHIESLCKKASCIHERALMIVYNSLYEVHLTNYFLTITLLRFTIIISIN